MADGEIKTEISRNELENTASNVLFFQIADDAGGVASITGGKLDVNATITGLETAYADNSTEFTIDTSDVNAQGFLVDEVTPSAVTEGRIGLARMTADRKMIIEIADATTDANRLKINSDGSVGIGDGTEQLLINTDGSITTQISDGTEILLINTDGSINVKSAIVSSGSEVHDFDQATAIAKAATSNHDYTVANTTFLCSRVDFAGSGRMKVEVQAEPIASLVTKAVRFTQRDTGGSVIFDPALPVPVASTGTLRVIRTQRSVGSLDMNSTIQGEDI